MGIINATPHEVILYPADTPDTLNNAAEFEPAARYAPSGIVARAAQTRRDVGEIDGVKVGVSEFGDITGLPSEQPGVWYVVSALTLTAAPQRGDLLVPALPVRDSGGRIVGCRAFDTNAAGAARLLYAVRYDDPAPWGINEQMVHPGGRAGEYNFAAILKFEMGHTHFSAVNAMRAIYHLEREMGEDNERR